MFVSQVPPVGLYCFQGSLTFWILSILVSNRNIWSIIRLYKWLCTVQSIFCKVRNLIYEQSEQYYLCMKRLLVTEEIFTNKLLNTALHIIQNKSFIKMPSLNCAWDKRIIYAQGLMKQCSKSFYSSLQIFSCNTLKNNYSNYENIVKN